MQTGILETTTPGEGMNTLNLGDIPDLSGLDEAYSGPQSDPWVDGWYEGTILLKREFTDKNGNDRVFESNDTVSAKGNSRNIRLQVVIKRRSDGKTLNQSLLLNYQPADLAQETVQAIAAQQEKVKDGGEWGPLFRSYMVLNRLAKLQKIAGVRQFQRTEEGGLDLTGLGGKIAFFRLGPDEKNPQFKAIDRFQVNEPKKVPVL